MKLPSQLTLAALAMCSMDIALAGGVRAGVHARPGEMVLIREVSTRPAYRPAPPGLALIVDPTPNKQLHAALGSGEMADEEFGQMVGSRPAAVAGFTGDLLAPMLGQSASGNPQGRDAGIGTLSSPLGAVGSATRGIGGMVRGALSQFPLGKQGGGP